MRVRTDDRMVRAIIEDGVFAAGDALASLLVVEGAAGMPMHDTAKRAVSDAFVEVVSRYELQVAWNGDPRFTKRELEKRIRRSVGASKNGDKYIPYIEEVSFRGIFRGTTCQMPEERVAAEMMRCSPEAT